MVPRVRGEVGGGGVDCPPAGLAVPVGGMRGMALKFSLTGVLSRRGSIGGLLDIVLAREGLSRSLIRASALSISGLLGTLGNGFLILDLPVKLGGVDAFVPRFTT